MHKYIVRLMTFLISTSVQGQVRPPLAIGPYIYEIDTTAPNENIRLFDFTEIASRKIDTAYIIYHPAGWDLLFPNTCSYSDTLEFYCFNSNGKIIQWTYFQQLGAYSSTVYYDSLGNPFARAQYQRE